MTAPAWATDAAGLEAWERTEDAWFAARARRLEAQLALTTTLLLYDRRVVVLRRAEEEMARAARRTGVAKDEAEGTWSLLDSALRMATRGR